jgi:hypothetical protein
LQVFGGMHVAGLLSVSLFSLVFPLPSGTGYV